MTVPNMYFEVRKEEEEEDDEEEEVEEEEEEETTMLDEGTGPSPLLNTRHASHMLDGVGVGVGA